MLLPVLLALASSAQPQPSRERITVTGYAWAPFISPMGEPFRPRSNEDDTMADWFNQADRNHDGVLTVDEMQADAARFFATLDTDRSGEIDPDELIAYEWQVAPEIQVNSKLRRARGEKPEAKKRGLGDEDEAGSRRGRDRFADYGPQGGARYALLNIPEPVAAADADFNRGISLAEFRQAAAERFALLDRAHSGRISFPQLVALRPAKPVPGQKFKRPKEANDTRVGSPLPPGP
jgi:Ca2+-binding EF-hand superfamily protein